MLHNSLSRHPVQSRYFADITRCNAIFDGENYKIDEYDKEIETKWKKKCPSPVDLRVEYFATARPISTFYSNLFTVVTKM